MALASSSLYSAQAVSALRQELWWQEYELQAKQAVNSRIASSQGIGHYPDWIKRIVTQTLSRGSTLVSEEQLRGRSIHEEDLLGAKLREHDISMSYEPNAMQYRFTKPRPKVDVTKPITGALQVISKLQQEVSDWLAPALKEMRK